MITASIHRFRWSWGWERREQSTVNGERAFPRHPRSLFTVHRARFGRKHARLRLASPARAPERPAYRLAGDRGLLRRYGTRYPAGGAPAGELLAAHGGGPGGSCGGG